VAPAEDTDFPLGRWDAWQRRHPAVAVPLAVVYKFFDDQGVYLAVIISYYAFVSVVPLLLLASSVLGFLLQGDPELRNRVLDSAVSGFPVVGDQLGRPEGLQGSTTAIVVGGLTALYGSLGPGTALQNALHASWAVPRNSRPNPLLLRLRSLALLVTGGLVLVATSLAGTVGQLAIGAFGGAGWVRWLLPLVSLLIVAGILSLLMWVGNGRRHPLRSAVPGAVVIGVLWQVLQLGSTAVIRNAAREASSMNQTFGLVLGLLAVMYVAALVVVIGIEINVVLARHLWPRALLTPFTDSVDLTDGDRRAYTGYARAQRHKGFEVVDVRFRDEPPPE
jgi:uncharacterized BrkB/YihY/UPF0761 family membrane protein